MKQFIHFDHVRLKPSEQIGIHQQPTWELSLVIEGEGIRTIAGVSEPFKSGEVVLVPPDTPHCWQFTDNGQKIENITVIFAPELIHTVAATFPELQTHFGGLAESIKAVVFTGRTRLRLSEGLKQMTSLIDDLAQHVGMNRSALCIFFKHHTGKTIITYLNEHRLSVACHLLRLTSLTVQQVCYESGFNDVPHFCRTFKKMEGLTPKEYRGNLSNNPFAARHQ